VKQDRRKNSMILQAGGFINHEKTSRQKTMMLSASIKHHESDTDEEEEMFEMFKQYLEANDQNNKSSSKDSMQNKF
jgi:arginyl-tRNA--protein-N-Asp/Glu arginylyltransferase